MPSTSVGVTKFSVDFPIIICVISKWISCDDSRTLRAYYYCNSKFHRIEWIEISSMGRLLVTTKILCDKQTACVCCCFAVLFLWPIQIAEVNSLVREKLITSWLDPKIWIFLRNVMMMSSQIIIWGKKNNTHTTRIWKTRPEIGLAMW